ncbi:hypothetical protein G6W61_10415 [Streptomyces sp. KAI-26]|uniref:hypothetical protein n=1 Tax=Streptomyces sp. KAI-26 TaxID=1169747 RepID=UPI001587B0E1|nr:hypothetical protein [Streptomyces sp. KAI-26]NUV86619.1 hypothetical protein [Streptomyces sp. KAI-26]NUW21186.1 hypothetical protein [Streptomyces roseoviolaceus]
MKPYTDRVTLSDGATVRVRIERGMTGDAVLHELNSNNWAGGGRIYWSGGNLYLMFGDELLAMQNARYDMAGSVTQAAEKALAFFVECAENCIRHAKHEGVDISACYTN